MWSKFPSGFFAFFLLLCLGLVCSAGLPGQEVVILETTWQGIKTEYALLQTEQDGWLGRQVIMQEKIEGLSLSNVNLLMKLNGQVLISGNWKISFEEMQNRAGGLETALIASEVSLKKVKRTMRREKIEAGLIGGAVGLVVGLVITGIIVSISNGL